VIFGIEKEGMDHKEDMENGKMGLRVDEMGDLHAHSCGSQQHGGLGKKKKMVFKLNEEKQVGFVGHFIYGGFLKMLWGILAFQFLFQMVITCQQFRELYSQERINIDDAIVRYELTCLSNDAKKARLFHSSCARDRIDKDKNAAWEAFVRLARKQRICGENDCSNAFYVFIGAILGILCLLFFIPKLHDIFISGIDRLNSWQNLFQNHPRDPNYGEVWKKHF